MKLVILWYFILDVVSYFDFDDVNTDLVFRKKWEQNEWQYDDSEEENVVSDHAGADWNISIQLRENLC